MYSDTLFSIFKVPFTLYDICLVTGVLCCFVFLFLAFKHAKFNRDATDAILFVGIFATAFGIFGAMLFQSVYDFIEDPSQGFKLQGRMTFIGGLISGAAFYLLFYNLYMHVIAPRTKINWLKNNANAGLCDALPIIPVGIVIAHAFGRLGCFFAGCCSGNPTEAWFGLACSSDFPGQKVVPIQLFECIFLTVLGIGMAILYFRFRFQANFGFYAIAYGVWRFIIEFFRGDERGALVGGISPSQFWSILMVAVGIIYFFLYLFVLKKKMKNPALHATNKK